jgi:hypothetical protein
LHDRHAVPPPWNSPQYVATMPPPSGHNFTKKMTVSDNSLPFG